VRSTKLIWYLGETAFRGWWDFDLYPACIQVANKVLGFSNTEWGQSCIRNAVDMVELINQNGAQDVLTLFFCFGKPGSFSWICGIDQNLVQFVHTFLQNKATFRSVNVLIDMLISMAALEDIDILVVSFLLKDWTH